MKGLVLGIFFQILVAGASAQTTYYVDPSGSDGNTGTSSSSAWRTIAKVGESGMSLSRLGPLRVAQTVCRSHLMHTTVDRGLLSPGLPPFPAGTPLQTGPKTERATAGRSPSDTIRIGSCSRG
jgi:hypothetical protein